MSSRKLAAACAIAALALALVYLAPLTGGRGPEMDEGAVVAYSARVLDGAVPHRDFLTFYGPGNLWIVAGAFAAFGETVATERAVGLAYRLVIVLALLLLGMRLSGIGGGALAGLVATVLLGQELVWAYATYGALAFGLLGLALMAWSATAPGRRQELGLALAGLAGGAAVLVRFDFAPAVVLGALPLLALVSRRSRTWYAGGLLGALTLALLHVAVVGPERIGRVAGDLVASGPGRSLPLPRPWGYPGNLLAVSGAVLLVLLVAGVVLWRRGSSSPAPQVLVAAALFGLATLPYALSRPDAYHVRPVALLPLALLPALALLAIRVALPDRRPRQALSLAVVVSTAFAVVIYGDFTLDRARDVRDVRTAYRGFLDDDSRTAVTAVLGEIRASSRSGESVFVGPQDLRRTNYGPTYMYFLLRGLEPASYYMEMNPGTANREGSGLADELRQADWLILTSEWDDWNEPNDSRVNGSDEPNRVVRDDFCLRLEEGQYRLYERCDRIAA